MRQVLSRAGRPLLASLVAVAALASTVEAQWDGDTFVVETIGQNGKTWPDMRGLPGTEALRVIGRFKRPSIGRITIDVTIDDPVAYTRPWDVQLAWRLVPDTDLIESICEEKGPAAYGR